jgi:hypothetical protein
MECKGCGGEKALVFHALRALSAPAAVPEGSRRCYRPPKVSSHADEQTAKGHCQDLVATLGNSQRQVVDSVIIDTAGQTQPSTSGPVKSQCISTHVPELYVLHCLAERICFFGAARMRYTWKGTCVRDTLDDDHGPRLDVMRARAGRLD